MVEDICDCLNESNKIKQEMLGLEDDDEQGLKALKEKSKELDEKCKPVIEEMKTDLEGKSKS